MLKHDMPCAIEKHVMVKLSVHVNVINVFHDVNSVLYSVTNFTKILSMFLVVKT